MKALEVASSIGVRFVIGGIFMIVVFGILGMLHTPIPPLYVIPFLIVTWLAGFLLEKMVIQLSKV